MKSVRLTNDLKAKIWKQIFIDKFEEEEKLLNEKYRIFANLCYEEIFTFDEQEMMNQAPNGAFDFRGDFYIYFGGRKLSLPLLKVKPFFYNYSNRNKFGHEHHLTLDFLELNNREEKLKEIKNKARSCAFAIMNSCTTTNKLLEVWPECKKYLEQAIGQPITNNLPAVVTTELNKMLGL